VKNASPLKQSIPYCGFEQPSYGVGISQRCVRAFAEGVCWILYRVLM